MRSLPFSELGRSRLFIPKLAFGCASLPDDMSLAAQTEAWAVLQTAWEAGIRYFDVAPHYNLGRCEEHLGAFLATKPRESYVLSTKVGRIITEDCSGTRSRHFDFSKTGLAQSLSDSQARLGVDKIDVLFVHDIGCPGNDAETDRNWEDLEKGGFDWLDGLREDGTIKSWGLGVNFIEPCLRAFEIATPDVVLLANQHSLLSSGARGQFFEICTLRDIGVVLGGVFATGILATGAVPGACYFYKPAPADILDKTRALEALCAKHGVALTSAALQFADQIDCVKAILCATSKPDRLTQNIADYRSPIPDKFWTDLAASGLADRAPF